MPEAEPTVVLLLLLPKSSAPAESRIKELSVAEPRVELKLEVERYGTSPRKCMPRRTFPVTIRLPLVSIGLDVSTRLLLIWLGGVVVTPAGFLNEGFCAE